VDPENVVDGISAVPIVQLGQKAVSLLVWDVWDERHRIGSLGEKWDSLVSSGGLKNLAYLTVRQGA